jgi:hypothetical protein
VAESIHPLFPDRARARRGWAERIWLATMALAFLAVTIAVAGLNTGKPDFFSPGTQPGDLIDTVPSAISCSYCHGYYDVNVEPYSSWSASMMGQAARDPIFHAAKAVANQDATFAGQLCLRCHAPAGYLKGDIGDSTGGMLDQVDRQGVSCCICHRMVDPRYAPGQSPAVDLPIIQALTSPPVNPGNGDMVYDPLDRRRGPFVLELTPHQWLQSPFHNNSALCATCHEVSNPLYTRQPNGTYVLNALNTPHPTNDRFDEFPIERTYSEWSQSTFAQGPIDMGGRFGGNNPLVSTCQDCHMPKTTGTGCDPAFGTTPRPNLYRHLFNGANTWVLRAVRDLYDDLETDTNADAVEASIARAQQMLSSAMDLSLSTRGNTLTVRITNQTGHKLPTGYPEGRRMWINVRFLDASGNLVAENGHYNTDTAQLTTADTKVYETKLGLDAAAAGASGKPQGPGFHFILNNQRFFDNRIPPMGFTNAGFASIQAEPVGYAYADGQNWDETTFTAPPGAVSAEARVFHQTTTKEYIEFLRDQNTTTTEGQTAYDQWVAHSKSPPTQMAMGAIQVNACTPDFDGDGDNSTDADIEAFFNCLAGNCCATCASADFNGDGDSATDADIEAFFRVLAGGAC